MTIPYKPWGDVENCLKYFEDYNEKCYSVDQDCNLVHGQKFAIGNFTMYLIGSHDMVISCILIENHHYWWHQTGIVRPF